MSARATETLGDALVDSLRVAADGSFVTDPRGGIILWNSAAEAILGYSAAEILGRHCCMLIRGEEINRNPICRPECAKRTATFDMRTRTKAGIPVWINVSVLLIEDSRDGAPFILHLFRDVTSSKEQLALVHEGLAGASDNGANGRLTRREREVLGLMRHGMNTAAMAQRLHLSRATVRNHVQNIFLKLDVHSRLEAVAHGLRHRLF